MTVKPRQRIKHVKEKDFASQEADKGANEGNMSGVPKNTPASGGMCSVKKSSATILAETQNQNRKGTEDVKSIEGTTKEKTISNESNSNEPAGSNDGPKVDNQGSTVVVQKTAQEVTQKTDEKKREEEFSRKKLEAINEGAKQILSCLEPRFSHEFELACNEYRCKDIGIYILAILNRLAKQADFCDPDFEDEWERGDVGNLEELYCRYCKKLIPNPTKTNQIYCCNLCAKYDREKNETGLVFPDETIERQTVEEQETEAHFGELKRVGE